MESSATFDSPGVNGRFGILSTSQGRLWLVVAVSAAVTLMMWIGMLYFASAAQKKVEAALAAIPESSADYQPVSAEVEKVNKLTASMLAAAEKKVQADRTGMVELSRVTADEAFTHMAALNQASASAGKALRSMEVAEAVRRERAGQLPAAASGFSRSVAYPTFFLLALGIGLIAGSGFWLSRSTTRPQNETSEMASPMATDNLSAEISPALNDETGEAQNRLPGDAVVMVPTPSLNDETGGAENPVVEPAAPASEAAQGGLPGEAGEGAGVAVTDPFNSLIAELRQLVGQVQMVAGQMTLAATETAKATEHVAQGSEQQTLQVLQMNKAISEMALAIGQVSESANVSSGVAQQALATARQGTRAAQGTIRGMERVRERVQQTTRQIRHLGESSQEIGEIARLIEGITDRTAILALNASVQAALAGGAGRSFGMAAEEIERLAERSAGAARRITELATAIQQGAGEALSAMEESSRDVAEGAQLAGRVGESLNQLEAASNNLAEVIQSIVRAAVRQADSSEQVTAAMSEIAEITQQTAADVKQSSVTVSDLTKLAEELNASVASFELPELPGGANDGGRLQATAS